MDGNSSILCFSYTASLYPSEQSLLIILICFCFNCFSGSLFTPGWGLQIPCCHSPLLYPQKTLLVGQDPPPIESRWSPGLPSSNHQAELAQEMKRTSLHRPFLGWFSNMEPMIWVFLKIFFPSHFLNIPTQFFTFLLLPGYQSLSGASNFLTQTTNLTNWNDGSAAEKTSYKFRCQFKSLLYCFQTMWLENVTWPPWASVSTALTWWN